MSAAAASVPPVTATLDVAADDPGFAGHYPGHPLLPGFLLVERLDRLLRVPGAQLVGIDRARFRLPIRPGDRLHVTAAPAGSDAADTGQWSYRCTVRRADAVAAEVRLRYRSAAGR
ncbi:MAG TPA: hypothetical protein VFY17_05675 [Pilimelia sp.]|nr:hypothetical protein [Pilimelia sp.]